MKHQTTIKIPVHSLIDLITNSSTEIFVNSESSVKPAKELLTELLKLEGSLKTVDDVFTVSLQKDYGSYFSEVLAENMEEYDEETAKKLGFNGDWRTDDEIAQKYLEDIESGKIEEPDYFEDLMDSHEINVDVNLVVKSNDPAYDHFLVLLKTFLYSPDYQEGMH